MSTIAERLSTIDTKLNNILTNANTELVKKGQSAVSDISHIATGIAGIQTGIDTSDATATAGDIVTGKTAYVDGTKLTGTYTGIIPSGTVNIASNGTVDVTNYASASVDVPTPSPTLQSKSVTITENGSQTITADSGYDGLSSVGVTVNVQGGSSEYNAKTNETFSNTYITLLQNITEVTGIKTTNMTSLQDMFNGCINLQNIDLSNFNTTKVTSMKTMFNGCQNLRSLNLSTFNTSKVTNMSSMFNYCKTLTELDVSSFNTSLVANVASMFAGCSALQTITFGNNFTLIKCTGTASMQNFIANSPMLSTNTLNEVLRVLATATAYKGTKTLAYIGMSSTQASTATGLSNWEALSALGWTTGY